MPKRLIYRIENNKGRGAYNSGAFRNDSERHPCPYGILDRVRGRNYRTSDFYYGFTNKRALKRWFQKADRIGLDRDGYFVSVYEVSEEYIFSDRYQAAFFLKKAKFIQDFALVNFT